MSSTISFCCGSGNIETVLLDEKNKSDIDRLTSMHFLCKPRRPQPHNLSPADVSLFPLLVSQQWNDYQQGNPHSKPKYDTKKPLQVEQPEQPEQPEVSKRSRRPTSLRPSSRKEKPAIPRLSFSANKDIAMAWMQMGRIKPLKTSTRHNPNTRVQAMAASQKIRHSFRSSSDETCVESVPISRSVIRHAGSKPVYQDSTPKNKRTGPSGRYIRPPPPPPQVSHCRRFRVCFGVMSDWKSAVDPKSGRTYYFNAVTKETQWRKPMELASDEERAEMEAKEKKQKDFFASMEANIIRSMAEGTVMTPKVQPMKQEPSVQPLRRPQVVRTISSMDEGILKDLVKRTPSITRTTGVTRVGSTIRSSALEKIQENSKEFDQSSFDYGNASMAFDGDASSANFGVSLEEIEALQELAKISKEMATVSDNTGMEMSSSEGFDMSFADFNISLSDDLNFSADSLNRSETKTSKEAPFGGLLFSPDFDEKKTAPSSASMAEIVFTPDVPVNKEPVVPSFGKAPAAAVIEEEEGLDLRSELKSKPVKFAAPKPAKPNKLTRRNTCGTIYVGTTMSAPDKDATMKVRFLCVISLYRTTRLANSLTRFTPLLDPTMPVHCWCLSRAYHWSRTRGRGARNQL
jgi:predicted Fe-Mo cluster-binding NifX family protein